MLKSIMLASCKRKGPQLRDGVSLKSQHGSSSSRTRAVLTKAGNSHAEDEAVDDQHEQEHQEQDQIEGDVRTGLLVFAQLARVLEIELERRERGNEIGTDLESARAGTHQQQVIVEEIVDRCVDQEER
jgi:hypothetical protein